MILNFLKDTFIKNNAMYMTGVLLVGMLGYSFHFLVSKKLSVSEYGELQSLLAVYSILVVFSSTLFYFVIKHTSVFAKFKDYEANKAFIGFIQKKSKKIAIILFIFFLFISPWLYRFLHLSIFWGLFFIAAAALSGLAFAVYAGELNAWEEFFSFTTISFLGALVKLIAGFLFAIFFASASMVALSFLMASLMTWFLARYFTNKKILKKSRFNQGFSAFLRPEEMTKKNWREYFPDVNFKKIIARTFIFSALFILVVNLDIVLVKNVTTSQVTGHYGALSLLGKIIFWVNSAIIAVALPRACAAGYRDQRASRKIILGAYTLIFLVGISGIFLYFLFPQFIITLLFGDRYVIFVNTLWLFGLMSLILSLFSLEANFSYAIHDFRISYILATTVLLMIFGIYFFHQNIKEIIWTLNICFLLGYLATLGINILPRARRIQEEVLIPQIITN